MLLVVYINDKTLKFYNSLAVSGCRYLEGMKRYLCDEHMNLHKQPLNVYNYAFIDCGSRVPQQTNRIDCGVLVCAFADLLSQNKRLTFSMVHVTIYRRRIVVLVITGTHPQYYFNEQTSHEVKAIVSLDGTEKIASKNKELSKTVDVKISTST